MAFRFWSVSRLLEMRAPLEWINFGMRAVRVAIVRAYYKGTSEWMLPNRKGRTTALRITLERKYR